jgi:hypothetical protein
MKFDCQDLIRFVPRDDSTDTVILSDRLEAEVGITLEDLTYRGRCCRRQRSWGRHHGSRRVIPAGVCAGALRRRRRQT